MATVLRVKRRCEDEPLDHLLISCKRKKVDETEETHVEADGQNLHRAVVKFAGTFDNQDINIAKHLKTRTKDDIEENYKKPTPKNVIENSRIKVKESSRQNRWKVINCSRSVDDKIDDNDEKISDNGMTIIDVEDCSTELSHDEEAKYVYDIYYTENNNDVLSFETGVIINEMEEDWLTYDDYREGEEYNCDNPDDSDSNSESNWRTDYGDEKVNDKDDGSINEEDMIHAFNTFGVEHDLSSDDELYNDVYHTSEIKLINSMIAENDYDDDNDRDRSDSEMSNYSGPVITEVNTDDEEIIA